jgi:7SK snRNA methylphosphate capping enzyme
MSKENINTSKQNNKTFIKKKRNRQEKQKELPKQLLNYPTKEEEYEFLKENKEYFDNIKDEKLDSLLKDKNYIFGNYSNFYYNRYLENFKENIENQISSTWFKDKICLDIGCNIGTLTMRLAQEYKPKMIIGIDIDYKLIKAALQNSKQFMRNSICSKFYNEGGKQINIQKGTLDQFIFINNEMRINEETKNIIKQMKELPLSFRLNLKDNTLGNYNQSKINSYDDKNIFFKQQNYVEQIFTEEKDINKFDTIICLDTIKWIHLKYGDIGVKVLFYNVYKQLKNNGLFLFDIAEFSKYKKDSKKHLILKNNLKKIEFYPQFFISYLQKVYNFKIEKQCILPPNSKKIFYRTIYVLKKSDNN